VTAPCVQGHTALIFDRGGTHRLSQIVDLTQVQWGRSRSAYTTASIVVAGDACRDQAQAINDIDSGRHELVLYRGSERVWEGPILQVSTFRDKATITARDIGDYLLTTALSQDWPWDTSGAVSSSSALMLERVRTIMQYELNTAYDMVTGTGAATQTVHVPRWENITNPANVWPYVDIRTSTSLLTRSNTVAMQMTLGEHLHNLAEGGLDFTIVGRKFVAWDSKDDLGRTRVVTDTDFDGDIEVIQAGAQQFSISHVSASANTDNPDAPRVGNAGGPDDFYGVRTNILSLSQEDGADTPTQDALNSQAQRDQVGRNPVPYILRVPDNSTLRLNDTLGINDLIPGVTIPIRTKNNLRVLQQDQRLNSVQVTETADGEQIQVSLSSWGEVVTA